MRASYVTVISLCVLCFAIPKSHAREEDHLARLFEAKFNKEEGTDLNFYDEFRAIDESRLLPQAGLKEKDMIEKLPGQPDVEFTQYGGYVTVDEKNGGAFYYYFTEAVSLKKSQPLLLWLNGGPGCSSLAYGAMQELGPFRVHSDGKTLFRNPYAWNKVANVLFVESPAGVGFSYTNTTSDLALRGDKMTAADNYAFLANWLERFPEYKGRELYISGESYAGHYVPQLAHTILQHNKAVKTNIINLKGIIIGNALINDETDKIGITAVSKQCEMATTEAEANVFGRIDWYNIYAPECKSTNLTAKPKKTSKVIDPCSDYYVSAYMNAPEVQKALHANGTNLSYDWEPCSVELSSDAILYWKDKPSTVIPLLQEFMANGLRVWVFSGDTDGRVPVTSTRYSLNQLKLPVKAKYRPWYVQGEVGGYTLEYKGDLTFATVRGAGHQVPSYQPERALPLIMHFLDGEPLPQN